MRTLRWAQLFFGKRSLKAIRSQRPLYGVFERRQAVAMRPGGMAARWSSNIGTGARMTKNVVVCCDGTANEFTRDRTNVIKLFRVLIKDPAAQVCYYHPGVGTMAAPGFVTKTGAFTAELAGLAFGYGLTDDLCDAYIFLCRNFDPADKLYLFGFSRGAYTARAL